MPNETLGAQILVIIDGFLLNNAALLIGLGCALISIAQFYYFYLRINRSTNDIDMGKQYVKLEMRRRYKL